MNYFEILLIALGLAMDASAVSVANGVALKEVNYKHALKFGLYCGVFQSVMPVLGWLIGMTFADYIMAISHWVAFILLAFIGGNMIFSALRKKKDEVKVNKDNEILRWQNLTMLAIATSIDAMAVGVSFAVLQDVNIWIASLIIGAVAFILSFLGVLLGKKLGKLFKSGAELIGGIILVLIGTKILIESLI